MKDFLKTVYNGIKITVIGLCGVFMDSVGIVYICNVSKLNGWWAVLVLLVGITLLLLSLGVYWGVGENIFDPNKSKEAESCQDQ